MGRHKRFTLTGKSEAKSSAMEAGSNQFHMDEGDRVELEQNAIHKLFRQDVHAH